jgi:hypothetical protein
MEPKSMQVRMEIELKRYGWRGQRYRTPQQLDKRQRQNLNSQKKFKSC